MILSTTESIMHKLFRCRVRFLCAYNAIIGVFMITSIHVFRTLMCKCIRLVSFSSHFILLNPLANGIFDEFLLHKLVSILFILKPETICKDFFCPSVSPLNLASLFLNAPHFKPSQLQASLWVPQPLSPQHNAWIHPHRHWKKTLRRSGSKGKREIKRLG